MNIYKFLIFAIALVGVILLGALKVIGQESIIPAIFGLVGAIVGGLVVKK